MPRFPELFIVYRVPAWIALARNTYTFVPTPDPLTSHHEIPIHLSCRAKKKAFAWSGSSIPRACYPGSAVCISISSMQHDEITAYRRRYLLTGGHICLRIHIQVPRFPEAFILYLKAVCWSKHDIHIHISHRLKRSLPIMRRQPSSSSIPKAFYLVSSNRD